MRTQTSIAEVGMVPVFHGNYLSVMSYRRDGSGVATPVWFVVEGHRLLVETDADSYKVKRIQSNPEVTVAECTARGRLRSAPIPACAEILPPSEQERVERLMARKYRIVMVLFRQVRAQQAALHLGLRAVSPS